MLCALAAGGLLAPQLSGATMEPPEAAKPAATVTVGTQGRVTYRVPLENGRVVDLRGANTDRMSGAVVWIDNVRVDGSSAEYSLRFVPHLPGEFDLAGLLERVDGRSTAGLPPLVVSVWSVLPEDHELTVIEPSAPALPRMGGYEIAMIAAIGAWALVPLVYVTRRLVRRKPKAIVLPEFKPTLADQLRPLVDAALNGQADRATLARLELLLLAYWRERLGLESNSVGTALRELKTHEQAGALLVQVERWLHAPPSRQDAQAARDRAAELLEPYRSVAPMENFASTSTLAEAAA